MAMTAQELQTLMSGLQESQMKTLAALQEQQATAMQQQQTAAVAAAAAAAPAQKELMDSMKAFITETRQQPQPEAKSSEAEKAETDNPSKTPKLESKAFHHMTKFSTGDAEWSDWSFDFKMLVRSINPWLTR